MIHTESVKAWEAESETFREIIMKQRKEIERLREICGAETSARGSQPDTTAPESRVAPSGTTSGQPIECCPVCNDEIERLRAEWSKAMDWGRGLQDEVERLRKLI